MDGIPELSGWGELTPWGLVLLMMSTFFFFLARSKLYTAKQVEEMLKGKDEVNAIYKASSEKWEATATNALEQNGILVPQLEIFNEFIQKADGTGAATPKTGHTSGVGGGAGVRT